MTMQVVTRSTWLPQAADFKLSSEIDSYHLLAIISVVGYEHLYTFGREVNRIWRRKMDICSALFVINRYSILLSATLLMIHFITWTDPNANSAQLACEAVSRTCVVLYILGRCATNGMAAIRMYGIWYRDKRILAVLLILGSVDPIASAIDSALYNVVVLPNGCDQVLKSGSPSSLPATLRVIATTVTIAFDALVLVLTLTQTTKTVLLQQTFTDVLGCSRWNNVFSGSDFPRVLNRVLYSSAITTLNILCLICLKDTSNQFVAFFLRMTAVLISRWVLNLRDFQSSSTRYLDHSQASPHHAQATSHSSPHGAGATHPSTILFASMYPGESEVSGSSGSSATSTMMDEDDDGEEIERKDGDDGDVVTKIV
ncbi:hypothetical protein K474DRAFT_1678889 [Panus rudis PR-1116 ss-1]|nr:hypothetical protein K474DRAFT_1678889 [Panus rudis PR-1116 ss-1]